MAAVSITRLRVRKLRYLPPFLVWAIRATRQARRAPGNISVGLLRDRNNTYWTKTVWKDDASMKAFMMSEHRRLEAQGRLSKVNYPTEAHRRLKFPPPRGSA